MNIPVFHDDQHGTAIISAAALLERAGARRQDHRRGQDGSVGAGAAAIACLDLMSSSAVKRDNIFVCDSKGVIHDRREDKLDESKSATSRDRGPFAGRRDARADYCSLSAAAQ